MGFLLDRPVYDDLCRQLVQQRFLVDGIASNTLRETLAQRQKQYFTTTPTDYKIQPMQSIWVSGITIGKGSSATHTFHRSSQFIRGKTG